MQVVFPVRADIIDNGSLPVLHGFIADYLSAAICNVEGFHLFV